MAGHQKSQSVRIFLEKVEHYNDQSLADFLFPIDGSEALHITQAIANEVQSGDLKAHINRAFLRLMKGYGFYRRQIQPLRIRLRPEHSKTVNWKAQPWISDEHPVHDRIRRILLVLRILNLQDEARAFHEALTSEPERITSKVSAKSQLQWKAAMDQNIAEYLAEDTSEKNDSTKSSDHDSLLNQSGDTTQSEPLSSEQQKLLERLIKEGTEKFAGEKRSMDEEEGNDNEPLNKRQKTEPVTWDRVRKWLEGYSQSKPALTWSEELHQRMEAHRKAFNAKPESERKEFKLPYTVSVVPWAIGSLWAPLRPTKTFGFGVSGLFERDCRRLLDPVAVCGKRYEQFLMPMFFPSHSQEQNADLVTDVPGHLIFTLADKTLGNYDDVVLQACNSLPSWFQDTGKNADDEIKEEAQAILHASNWLARRDTSEELRNRPYNLTIHSITVPEQGNIAQACGLHTILMAWAILLGISLYEQEIRGGTLPEQAFLTLGTEIVNLAIAGCMDSHTIQAFLNVSGMVIEQDVDDRSIRLGVVNTLPMNDDILKDVVIADGTLD